MPRPELYGCISSSIRSPPSPGPDVPSWHSSSDLVNAAAGSRLADTPACHGWPPFLCKQMKLSMHSAKDDPISYINNNKGETLAGSFSSVFLKKLRTTSQDGSERMWTSWNSFKQRLMFLTFPLSFNWMSKGYKTAVSLSSSLICFVVGYTLLLSFDVWIFQLF